MYMITEELPTKGSLCAQGNRGKAAAWDPEARSGEKILIGQEQRLLYCIRGKKGKGAEQAISSHV